ncbi:unnamed protein product [Dibothriocephalus latus]|uniref:TRPM-like domain-containing protein n=1 Tax=Dibothriocephalus latus TaxID=60516 RepID=A0A3P7L623_DIBLA|nr:unnamed protein product [Dibothriocephalus latus]
MSTVEGLRKTSFAGKHRGHHRLEAPKLTSEERGRIIAAAVKRHEAERAEEKERKRRHRLAQGKRSFYERLTGINIGFSFGAMSKVNMERPAKELMLMCILLGKVKLAELFWAYEKEPIGGAMFCTVLLGKMSESATDLAQKSEFESHARIFEEKAEGVLEECYTEDSARAKMLLYRQLEDYGSNAVIRLAARGSCIHFMSHPCCQDFLSEVWMGKLSAKNSIFHVRDYTPPAPQGNIHYGPEVEKRADKCERFILFR